MQYKSYQLFNFEQIPQSSSLTEEQKEHIRVVGSVLPFKTNSYVTERLINWDDPLNDPMFVLTFPQKGMLIDSHYERAASVLKQEVTTEEKKRVINDIRMELNPHPAGQLQLNVPTYDDVLLSGVQHKYRETVLFFPQQGQTCHAYCSFCFRWPQFTGMSELKFASREAELLAEYVAAHQEITDVLFTGGDPMIMRTAVLEKYIRPLLDKKISNLQHIRIGTKSLGFWPMRFTQDEDAATLLELFRDIKKAGVHLAIMAHFNHPAELSTPEVAEAVERILETGAVIRTQSPIIKHINDSADVWATMLRKQVSMGMIPYYMFVARNTGAQHYFSVPLVEAWQIFRQTYQKLSGICRTVRGPSMSCLPGKMQVLGVTEVQGEKVFVLRMIQGRNPDWVARPFFAKYDEKAVWYSDLKPAFEEKFFFTDELNRMQGHTEEEEYE